MFTGIIEGKGTVKEVIPNGSNRTFWIASDLSRELKVDQSISHNGACLTVEEVKNGLHRVTAIDETLQKTNLGSWQPGATVNLERCLLMSSRLDGHFVQGHVDTTGTCLKKRAKKGSLELEITFPRKFASLIIEKGSICVDGISLTAFNVKKKSFTVAIIPFTADHTNINGLSPGETVNLEFDIIGKYLFRRLSLETK